MVSSSRYKLFFALIVLLFVLLRLPGLDLSYHQDERKYADTAPISQGLEAETPHPPLTEIIFALTAEIFGEDNFRATPFIFGLANLFLVYFLVKSAFGTRAALWSALLFAISFYSVLASLMVDIDGQVLPFFVLAVLIFYFKWQEAQDQRHKFFWGTLFLTSAVFGFLTKLSFVLIIGAVILDFFFSKKELLDRKSIFKYGLTVAGLLAVLALALLNAKLIYPNFDLSRTISHAKDFMHFSQRAYFQVIIQFAKALMYCSPLLILPLFLKSNEKFSRFRIFWIFLGLGLVFYLAVFDFSLAALDKYLAFAIVPLCVISGTLLAETFSALSGLSLRQKVGIVIAVAGLSLFLFSLQYLNHYVPPLYPKEEWLNRIFSLDWSFLIPFTGGSGPLGFYVSWLFIACVWIVSALLVLISRGIRARRFYIVAFLVALGFTYNFSFIEEYLFGRINGNPNILLKNALEFIEKSPNISRVMTYNDIGGFELAKMGKYYRRIYVAPKYEKSYIDLLNNFKGCYLVVEIPKLSPKSIFSKYFASCEVVYNDQSGYISAKIYDCKKAINL